jgi:YbbR domain-containing protein
MKEKLTKNIGLKILSVILAAIMWLVITNVDDPVVPVDFRNVPVTILNEEEIAYLDQVYEIVEGETIDFTVAARRTIADNLAVSDFKVTADFAKLSDVNAVTINISCPRYGDDVTVIDGLYQVMKINREELVEKHFKVNVVLKGEPAEGYFIGEKTASTILRVSGPKSKIERIKDIVVEVDVDQVSGSFRTIEEPKALDEEGNEIDASNLKFSQKAVTIYIGVYKTKTINLQITASGKPAEGYVMTNIEYGPETIEVAGDDEALRSIQYLSITESISGATSSIIKEINLEEKLREGLVLVGENKTAAINITIEKKQTKEINIWPGDIEIRGKENDMTINFISTGPITIKLTGPAAELDKYDRTNLKPYIDITGYTTGTYTLDIKANVSGDVSLSNVSKVSMYLAKTESE